LPATERVSSRVAPLAQGRPRGGRGRGLLGRRLRSPALAGAALAAAGAGLAALRRRDDRDAERLAARLVRTAAGARFDTAAVAGLPPTVQRYFRHAIGPGTALAGTVRLEMAGEMRLGPRAAWLPFRARQVLAPPEGFVWRAGVGRGAWWFVGADRYAGGRAATRFWLWGALPVARAGGGARARDVARSAIGRMAAESIWAPAALLPSAGVRWAAPGDDVATGRFAVAGEEVELTLRLDAAGAVREVRLPRWGNQTPAGRYAAIPFGARVTAEGEFGGYTVPTRLAAAWWLGTDREFEFIRVTVRRAVFA
jgi:hypothetical protein